MSAEPNLVGVPQTDRGPWMQTWLGGRFYPLDPRPEDIDPRDIARGLAFQNRYHGQTSYPLTIAQHSCVAADHAEDKLEDVELARVMLLHDATEAYLGDMNRPLKSIMPQYRELEANLWRAIAARFSLPREMPEAVKRIDDEMLAIEKANLAPNAEPWPGIEQVAARHTFVVWPPQHALMEFNARFHRLFPDDAVLRPVH